MSTATAIIKSSYRLIGIKNPTSTDLTTGLEALNNYLAFLSTEKINIPFATKDTLALIVGQSSYTIGTGANFNTSRPDSLSSAYVRDSASIDYSVDCFMTLQEYNDITDKATSGRPSRLYYDTQYANAIIYFNVKADYAYTFILHSFKPLTQISNPDVDYSIDSKYLFFLQYNLALNLAPEFSVKPSPVVVNYSIQSKAAIQDSNPSQVTPVTFEFAHNRIYR